MHFFSCCNEDFCKQEKRVKLLFQAALQVFFQDFFFFFVVIRKKPTNFITKEKGSLGHSNINQCLGF